MALNQKKKSIMIPPPGGEKIAQYTVDRTNQRMVDRYVVLEVLGTLPVRILKIAVLAVLSFFVFYFSAVWKFSYGWIIAVLFLIGIIYQILKPVVHYLLIRKKASVLVNQNPVTEKIAFYEEGILYSDSQDLLRLTWKDIGFVLETGFGIAVFPGEKACPFLISPELLTNLTELRTLLKKNLKFRYIRVGKKNQTAGPEPANQPPVFIEEPGGRLVARMRVFIESGELHTLYDLWTRQILNKRYKGVILNVVYTFLIVALVVFGIFFREMGLFIAALCVGALIPITYYLRYVTGMMKGRGILANSKDYKKKYEYTIFENGVMLAYSYGISSIDFREFELIFEDKQGMILMLNAQKTLYIPKRYFKSIEGQEISTFLKSRFVPPENRHAAVPKKINSGREENRRIKKTESRL